MNRDATRCPAIVTTVLSILLSIESLVAGPTAPDAEFSMKSNWSRLCDGTDYVSVLISDDQRECLEEVLVNGSPFLEHKWRFPLLSPGCHYLVFEVQRDATANDLFRFAWKFNSTNDDGFMDIAGAVASDCCEMVKSAPITCTTQAGDLYIALFDQHSQTPVPDPAISRVYVNYLRVETR